jgi:hypothetical protein
MRKAWGAALACAALLFAAPAAHAGDSAALERYAAATWASFDAMTDAGSGLPTDVLHADGRRDVQTSTTNIGAYMGSAVAAERLGIIGRCGWSARSRRWSGWSATRPRASSTTGTTTAAARS